MRSLGLNDAIESGLVKTPRVVVRDDAVPDAKTYKSRLTQDAVVLVNAFAGYQFNDNFSAQLNINNLLDKKYYSNVGFYDGVNWGEPRNVRLSLRWKL